MIFVFAQDIHHFQLYGPNSPWYHTRLRPGTYKFLSSISELYELHICTFGARNYAHTITHILDPKGKLFSHRVLSRDECFNPNSKTGNLKYVYIFNYKYFIKYILMISLLSLLAMSL